MTSFSIFPKVDYSNPISVLENTLPTVLFPSIPSIQPVAGAITQGIFDIANTAIASGVSGSFTPEGSVLFLKDVAEGTKKTELSVFPQNTGLSFGAGSLTTLAFVGAGIYLFSKLR